MSRIGYICLCGSGTGIFLNILGDVRVRLSGRLRGIYNEQEAGKEEI